MPSFDDFDEKELDRFMTEWAEEIHLKVVDHFKVQLYIHVITIGVKKGIELGDFDQHVYNAPPYLKAEIETYLDSLKG